MPYHEDLQGVYITPEFYSEIYDACRAQVDYVRRRPNETEITAPLSSKLLRELHDQVYLTHRYAVDSMRVEEGKIVVDTTVKSDLSPEGSIKIAPPDVEHIVEALGRQASSLMIDSVNYYGSLAGALAMRMMSHKIELADALERYCSDSMYGRRGIPNAYAPSQRPYHSAK